MIQLAVLVPMLALSAATPQTVSAEQTIAPVQAPTAQFAQDEGGGGEAAAVDPGFFEKYYPFTFADGLEAETDENFVLLYVVGIGFALSNIWGPIVLVGNPGDYLIDSLIITVLHWVPLFIPFLNFIYAPINFFYLLPVATINAFDRNLKNAKAAGTWKAARRDLRLPKSEELAALGTPAMAF